MNETESPQQPTPQGRARDQKALLIVNSNAIAMAAALAGAYYFGVMRGTTPAPQPTAEQKVDDLELIRAEINKNLESQIGQLNDQITSMKEPQGQRALATLTGEFEDKKTLEAKITTFEAQLKQAELMKELEIQKEALGKLGESRIMAHEIKRD